MVLSWRSKNTTNVTPVAIFASLLSQRVCALTSIQYCQTSFPKVWYQFISSTSSYKRASFPSVLPTHDITDLWFLASMIAKTCCLNVVLVYISIMKLYPLYVQELLFCLFFTSFAHFSISLIFHLSIRRNVVSDQPFL